MRLVDGRLAGSALTMDAALRNLVALGLELDEAVRRLATLPADRLGRADLGRIAEEARADLVVLDEDLAVQRVVVAGHDAF
jgi:N-acetylglucosamine-6-phosphate deacetylase